MKLKDTDSTTHIVAIIDRSGSMAHLVNDSIGGFNSFLREQRKLPGKAKISTVLFNGSIEFLCDDVDINEAPELSSLNYKTTGGTAMNDAIGQSLTKLLAKSPSRAIVCILTDGEENASKEYTASGVKALIEQARAKDYAVVFLAANQDAFQAGSKLGIMNNHNYKATSIGTRSAYATLSATATNYRNEPANGDN